MKILAFFRESFCSLETLKIYKIELEFVVRNQFFCLCFNFNSWNNLEEYVEDIMDEDIIRVNRNISEESESLASVLTPGNSNFVQYIDQFAKFFSNYYKTTCPSPLIFEKVFGIHLST